MNSGPTLELGSAPQLVAIGGPNGAGKTTFYHSQIAQTGLRLVNADVIAKQLKLEAYSAASVAEGIRHQLITQRESFAFETVFSDPVGAKVQFLVDATTLGYDVTLCFIGLPSVAESINRVAMRVTQGGHDVPREKLKNRYPRSLNNLSLAIGKVPRVLVFDQGDLREPFRYVAQFEQGKTTYLSANLPTWLKDIGL